MFKSSGDTKSVVGQVGPPGTAVLKVTPWSVIESITSVADGSDVKPATDLTTPCVVTLPPGEYKVRARNAAVGQAFEFTITVEAGKTVEALQRLPGFNLDAELDKVLAGSRQ
jgi:hypothetical protein